MAIWDIFGGVDPGKTCALALIMPDGSVRILDYAVGPAKQRVVNPVCFAVLSGLTGLGYRIKLVIEKSEPRPPTTLKNAFAMGMYYRDWVEWHFKRLGLSYDVEIPATWQKAVFDTSQKKPKKIKRERPEGTSDLDFKKLLVKDLAEHKKKLKTLSMERAKRLYPGAAITRHDHAEALLVAHFCWLKYH